jgi:hypothetical protein
MKNPAIPEEQAVKLSQQKVNGIEIWRDTKRQYGQTSAGNNTTFFLTFAVILILS